MATYRISNAGNSALQAEVWTLALDEAVRAIKTLAPQRGDYWETVLVKPYRRAKRAKLDTVQVITGGYSSGELSNTLGACQCAVTRTA